MKAVIYEKYGSPGVLELREIAKPAHRYVDKGHKKGNVVITLDHRTKA